jgi:hypothetical protein
MKVENVKVIFRYAEDQSSIKALVVNVNTKETIADREVILRHGDKPQKVLGRKYAFKKLMNHVMYNNILPKPMVGEFWKQFGNQCRQPRQKLAY